MFLSVQSSLGTLAGVRSVCAFYKTDRLASLQHPQSAVTEKQTPFKFQLWDLDRHSPFLYIVIAWHTFQLYFSPLPFLLPSLLLFSASFHGRKNSDSEDEDSGSDRSSAIFSRIQKAERRLDSSCQRRSLLMELATHRARSTRDTRAAGRTSGASDEPRCPCLHAPSRAGPGLQHLCQLLLPC